MINDRFERGENKLGVWGEGVKGSGIRNFFCGKKLSFLSLQLN